MAMSSGDAGLLCPNCGETTPPGEFCAVCGARLVLPARRDPWRWVSGVAAGLLAVWCGLVGASCTISPFRYRGDWIYDAWPLWVGLGAVWLAAAWWLARWALRRLRGRSPDETREWLTADESQGFGDDDG